MIALAWALVGLAALGMGAAVTFAVMNSRARDQREAARVLASSTAGELVRVHEALDRLAKDLKSEQERSDALDDELAKTYNTPDPVGARDRVLAKWTAARAAARGDGARAVPAPEAARDAGPNDILNPFDPR